MKRDKYLTNKVFTPTTPAELCFVERVEINEQLVDALKTPGLQLIVYGHSGSGKTTLLLNKLNQLYENYIISRCTESISIEHLLLDAFDKLDKYYTSEITKKKTSKIGLDIAGEYLALKNTMKFEYSNETSIKQQRIVPIQLTAQRLAEFLGAANCCWVIEDFHKVIETQKKELSQRMKVFMDSAFDYPELKIIAIGAVGTAREVVAYDKEMQNRVAEIHVPLMSKTQLIELIKIGENLLNVKFPYKIKDIITDLSNGLASVCHQLCLNICFSNNIYQTVDEYIEFTKRDLDKAIEKYVNQQSDTLKAVLDNAIKVERTRKYENGKLILTVLSQLAIEYASHDEILTEIRKVEPKYPSSNLTTYLKTLTSSGKDEILKFDEKSNKYSFTNPFVKVYARMMLANSDERLINTVVISGNSNILIQRHHGYGDNVAGDKIVINNSTINTNPSGQIKLE